MIITRLKIDNLYGFQDFELDLTYPRKQPQSFVDYEYLEDVPSFKFKRVCILMGTNASGKTSLGKVLWGIQSILNIFFKGYAMSVPEYLLEAICNKDSVASIHIEFLSPKQQLLHFFSIKFDAYGMKDVRFNYIELKSTDTNQTASKRLYSEKYDTDIKLNQFISSGKKSISFYYIFVENHMNELEIDINKLEPKNLENLLYILQTFDSSIVDVSLLTTTRKNNEIINEGYTIFFKNGNSVKVTNNGETFTAKDKNRFSKGTYDVLSIADFIFSILNNKENTSTYFLDEKLASSHSELEITILNLIIQKLNKHSQFFYTTHNYDVLDLNLPAHSFVFLHKEDGYCQAEQPEKLGFSKNDRKLKGYVRNNYFRTVPSTHLLDELMWGDDDE